MASATVSVLSLEDALLPYVRRFRKGAVLFEEGDEGSEMFVILSGQIMLYHVLGRTGTEGTELVPRKAIRQIATLKDGDFFGEMALLEDRPRMSSAVAFTDSKVVSLNRESFNQVVSQRPEFALMIMTEMSRRIRSLERRISLMS